MSKSLSSTQPSGRYIMCPVKSVSVSNPLKGTVEVDGDKSISHRAVLFNAISNGQAKISKILEGEDVIDTIKCLQSCGVSIVKKGSDYIINGVGLRGLKKPENDLYFGNSGTSARLFMGVLAGQGFSAKLTGDASLNKRDMKRVVDPLTIMGAGFTSEEKKKNQKTTDDFHEKSYKSDDKITLPITITGTNSLTSIEYKLPMASAQVKSAILLAGLNAKGKTVVVEKNPSRNHTEIILKAMGANIVCEDSKISIIGNKELNAMDFVVPGDPSSAAFIVAAALLVKDSDVTIKNVCINRTRMGFYETLKSMGAKVSIKQTSVLHGEPVGEINAKYSPDMNGVEIDPSIVPSMIDEFPILSVVASFANGRTKMSGLKELTTKESNRLLAIANGLSFCGVSVNYGEIDHSLVVYGDGINKIIKTPTRSIATQLDHRIAMSFLIAGLKSDNGIVIDDKTMIKTSFPNFEKIFTTLGGKLIDVEL